VDHHGRARAVAPHGGGRICERRLRRRRHRVGAHDFAEMYVAHGPSVRVPSYIVNVDALINIQYIGAMARTYLSAAEAAHGLGVTLPTLYAYVSRGLVRSERVGQARARRYHPARGPARTARRPPRRHPPPPAQ